MQSVTEQSQVGVRVLLPSSLLLTSFPLSRSALMPHRETAEANLLPAPAPCNKSV